MSRNRGVSPVIATIILSAVVITIGGAIWSYSQGSATVIAQNYVNDTMDLLKEVIERFAVEHVTNSSDGAILKIWIFNYGETDIIVDVYANVTDGEFSSNLTNTVLSKSFMQINIQLPVADPIEKGDMVAITVHSRRQNNSYYTYNVF